MTRLVTRLVDAGLGNGALDRDAIPAADAGATGNGAGRVVVPGRGDCGDAPDVADDDTRAGAPVTTVRSCRVSVTTADDVTHTVDVQAATVFEAAAAGLARFRDQGWVEPLAPTAVIRVEVQVAPVVHSVPLKALERWANGPSVSPKEEVLKRPLRRL